ncbi:MAG: hypothetical protein MZU91_05145 [Desulfosudis oleivorans]|nr:hypothetical protein [Desulfosudis oleivorans]
MLHGLLRVRGFTQDDAHIFCTARPARGGDPQRPRLRASTSSGPSASSAYDIYLSTRPEKSVGSDEQLGAWRPHALQRGARDEAVSPTQVDPGEGRLLRAEDRHQDQGRPRPVMAVLRPSRSTSTCPSGSISTIPGQRRQGAPADHDPPGAPGLAGAVLRRAHRALCRRSSPCGSRRCRSLS